MVATKDLLTSTPVTSAAKSAVTGSVGSAAAGYGGLASVLAKGAFGGVPSGKATVSSAEAARQQRILTPLLEQQDKFDPVPAGMTRYQYNLSKMPPPDPLQQSLNSIKNIGGQTDDDRYEAEQLSNYYQSPAGQKELKEFYAANPEWYNPDGTRTDYAGPYAPSRSEQAAKFKEVTGRDLGSGLSIEQQNAIASAGGTPTAAAQPPAATGGGTDIGSNLGDILDNLPDPNDAGAAAAAAGLPSGTEFQYTAQQAADNEFVTEEGKILGEAAIASEDDLQIMAAQSADLGIPDVTKIGQGVPDLEAIEADLPEDAIIEDVVAEVSQRYLEQEAVNKQMIQDFQVFQGSTVKEQLAMLQDDWTGTNGQNKVPFYAQGAVTAAKQEMAARGLGGSSMAAAAITQAGLESMIPVAMADAQFFQTLSLKSFDMQTSMGLAKLAHIANLDMSELGFRQQKAVDTANKFFQVNMSNIDNERLVAAINNANRMQALFSDQAAQNVANNLQFTTQAESDRFYAQLSVQAQESSARLLLDARKFNASVQNSRDEFNATMRAEIERDNVNYLRAINTANTAGINQQNMVNTQNLLNISNTAIANALTLRRDQLNRIFESSENAAARANNYAIAKLGADAAMQRLTSAQQHENSQAVGGWLSSLATPFIERGVDWLSDALF